MQSIRSNRPLTTSKLSYTIDSCSSHSAQYHPRNVMTNSPQDQGARWSSASNSQLQYITLKLDNLAIANTITFGKFHKQHPCNLKEFKVYGGLDPQNMVELLHAGLRNDAEPETFALKHITGVNRKSEMFPCLYIKVCPLLAWESNFPFSIWYIEVRGTVDPDIVHEAYWNYVNYREQQVLKLCLKHFRQRNYLSTFTSLQLQSQLSLEDPLITSLFTKLVLQGDFNEVEKILTKASSDGLFQEYISDLPYKPIWKRLDNEIDESPCKRGGHQMLIDSDTGLIYLFGGWDGTKDLSDFWTFDHHTQKWSCISDDTRKDKGPQPRSCHKMCMDPKTKQIYVLGRYVDSEQRASANLENDFWRYCVYTKRWHKISEHTARDDGPELIYDHQMVVDSKAQMVYVFGGRVITSEPGQNSLYSGLYAYCITTNTWRLILNDTSQPDNAIQLKSRIGHSMLLNSKTHELYIFAGQRKKDYLSDFYVFDLENEVVYENSRDYSKQGGPDAGFTQRATMDHELGEFYVLSGLMREKLTQQDTMKNSFWVYRIKKGKWNRIYENENVGGEYWQTMQEKEPCPRFAHQLVYDEKRKVHYMFGGNPGEIGNVNKRLKDFWELKLVRPSTKDILRRAKFYTRSQRFREMCLLQPDQPSTDSIPQVAKNIPDLETLLYLQTEVANVVDHGNEEETKDFRILATLLFQKTVSECFESEGGGVKIDRKFGVRGMGRNVFKGEVKVESGGLGRESFLGVEENRKRRGSDEKVGGMGGVPIEMDESEVGMELSTVSGPTVVADETYQSRIELFEKLLSYFPESMREPTNSLIDLVPIV
ncbi:Muskelin 1, intracellular mediator containing kelch motif [Nowakowskiella sp. JEL0407]|nr:Muskelin 1, intracellular mediator containing kelch motif [Nowakowskiella sp. JEL0407]